jgi:hypothetical protein
MSAPSAGSRARLLFAGGAAAILVTVVAVVAIGSSGSSEDGVDVAAAPPECVRDWNEDPEALNAGRHNSVSHAYLEVQVTRLAADGSEPAPPAEGLCAVVFARTSLDPEPVAAAMILRRGEWVPLSTQEGVTPRTLTELQAAAFDLANAGLEGDGSLTPAESSSQ